jgi:uncharacterized Tic20 family protein
MDLHRLRDLFDAADNQDRADALAVEIAAVVALLIVVGATLAAVLAWWL